MGNDMTSTCKYCLRWAGKPRHCPICEEPIRVCKDKECKQSFLDDVNACKLAYPGVEK